MISGFTQFKEGSKQLLKIIKKTTSKRQWTKHEKRLKHRFKMEPKSIKKPSKNRCGQKLIFGSIFPGFFGVRGGFFRNFGVTFSPNLPSVRKVNCRKTNKRKKNRRKRNSAGKEALLSKSNTPLGLRSRPGADLSCLRQFICPGPAKIDVCENL